MIDCLLYLLNFVFSCLCWILIWGEHTIGNVSIDLVVFHLFMPLKNAPTDWAQKIYIPICGIVMTVIVLYYIGHFLLSKKQRLRRLFLSLILFFFVIFDCYYANKHYYILDFLQ